MYIPSWKDFQYASIDHSRNNPTCVSLPKQAGIYCIDSNRLGLLYVGQTNNLRLRIACHNKKKSFLDNDASLIYYYLTEGDILDRRWIEYCFIKKYRPILNREIKHKIFLRTNAFSFQTKEQLFASLRRLNNVQLRCLANRKMIDTGRASNRLGRKAIELLLARRLIDEKSYTGTAFVPYSFLKF